eukprot:758625-Hanusia_phi.AAC.7
MWAGGEGAGLVKERGHNKRVGEARLAYGGEGATGGGRNGMQREGKERSSRCHLLESFRVGGDENIERLTHYCRTR